MALLTALLRSAHSHREGERREAREPRREATALARKSSRAYVFLTNFWQTLRGPFSVVSKPILSSKYSFELGSNVKATDLQDLYTSSPLRIQKVS